MVKQPIKVVGLLLFIVFLAGIMPKEYIHDALFDHVDDVHPVYAKGEIVITKKHNHCSFLSFEFAPFVTPQPYYFSHTEVSIYTVFVLPIYSFHYFSPQQFVLSRGPPLA